MKFLLKSKPFGILSIGLVIGFVGAIAKITKENFADSILAVSLLVEIIGLIIFYRWYSKARESEKKISNS